jgi:hypothetical protein
MIDEEAPDERQEAAPYPREPESPTFGDGIRFLYARRVRLAAHFVILCVVGLLGFAVWLLLRPSLAEGRLLLTFRGIEIGEYPSGRKFSTEDFRASDILRMAVADAGIPRDRADLNKLSAHINVTPIIPPDVIARWKKQDRDGNKREEYVPREFELTVGLQGISPENKLRLFDAIVKRYRAHLKFEEAAALRFVSDWSRNSYSDLAKNYDYWEIPYVLGENVDVLNKSLARLVDESRNYKDSSAQLTFRDVQKDLAIWSATRLEALRALTYKGRLVKNKTAALLTAQYRLEDLTIQARARTEETAEALKLVETLQKPQPLVATQYSGKEGIPVLDASVMERVVRSDYLSPLVRRVSELQQETKDLEAKKWRLERDLTYLPEAHDISANELPQGYQDLVASLSRELSTIVGNYNTLLDHYLTETVSSLVTVEEGPRITRGLPAVAVLAVILFLCAILALFSVVLEQVVVGAIRRSS